MLKKPFGNRPLGTPIRMWKDNIKMDRRKAGFNGVLWMKVTNVLATSEERF
jgi:hypothetical protein